MNSLVRSNSFASTKGLPTFTMIHLFNFTQNLMKHKVNLNAYWCSKRNLDPKDIETFEGKRSQMKQKNL